MGSHVDNDADASARPRARTRAAARRPWRWLPLAVLAGAVLAACHPPPEFARELEPNDMLFEGDPSVTNGVRIYLSSPRHASSGARGECGWEENINGRLVNLDAATATYGSYGLADDWEYEVVVSGNPHDDGYLKNRDASNNFGADLHLTTHTNANGSGCGDAAQYVLTMFNSTSSNSVALANQLATALDPVVPGHKNSWNCDGLAECGVQAPHVAYLELFFHTNRAAADWFMAAGGDHTEGCQEGLCGWAQSGRTVATAVDTYLGHPRPASPAEAESSPLDAYPGFGRSPQAMLRDDTIAYWEAYQREVFVADCMADAGFSYAPAVAYPTEAMQRVAENVRPPEVEARARAAASPEEQNRVDEQALPPADRDLYHRTLVGETAADIDAAARDGAAPDGQGADFATGGCVGQAHDAIPSIWDARRAMGPALAGTWNGNADRAVAAAAELVDDNAALLAAVDARYRGVTERIAHDGAFLDYLARQAQLADQP
jgi:hypothetical protein